MEPHGVLAYGVLDFLARNWALMSIVITLVVLVVVPAIVIRKYLRLIANLFDDALPPPSINHLSDRRRVEGEEVDFRAFDGHLLRGMMISGDSRRATRGMIIFAHEFKSDARSCARYVEPLLEAGYDVFSLDFRGHGQSADEEGYRPRQWASDREVNDMLGAIAYVEDHLESAGRPPDIGLFGISRGAGVALLAAQGLTTVQAIVTDGAFSSDTTLEYLMKRWAKIFAKVRVVYENHPRAFWRFLRWLLFRECSRRHHCSYPSVRKALTRLKNTPIFMIHGEKDSCIPVSQTQMLYDLARGPKYIWIVPGAKHNQSVIVQSDEYAAKTLQFFNRYLAGVEADTDQLRPLHRLTQPLADPCRAARSGLRPADARDAVP